MTTNPPIALGLIARSWPPATRWSERILQPSALMMPVPPLAPRSLMATSEEGVETWFMEEVYLELHPGDAANLRQNLAMNPPKIWVALADADDPKRVRVQIITADPFEGEALATDPGLTVAALSMPAPLRAHIAAFAELFPEEERFRKKRRSGIEAEDPSLAAPRILPGGHRPGARRTEAEAERLAAAGLTRDPGAKR